MMFVIKGMVNNEIVYYSSTEEGGFYGIDIQKFVRDIKYAKIFYDPEEAEETANLLINIYGDFKIYPVCPECGKDYTGYPALSRKDNTTRICSECGIREALEQFIEKKDY